MSALSIRFAAAVFVAVALVSAASAGIIVSNSLTGSDLANANPYAAGMVTDTNVSSTGIGFSSGLLGKVGTSQDNRYVAQNWSTGSVLDPIDYFTFTINANAGYQIDFDGFDFSGQRGGSTASGAISNNGPTSFAVRSSADGFVSDLATPSYATINSQEADSVTLTTAPFQNVTSIEFRVYGWNAGTTTGGYSINDYEFFGTISAVPEPTSLILVGMACAPMLLRRRSKVA